MKLCCAKCKKVVTKDMYQVKLHKFGYMILNKSAIYDKVTPSDEYELSSIWTMMKSGVFYIKNSVSASSTSYKDYYHVDSKLQIEGNSRYKDYHHVTKRKPKRLVVGASSVLEGVIPPYKTGCGCCNHSGGRPLVCECGNVLGGMYLDCYEDGRVEFVESKVDRVFK